MQATAACHHKNYSSRLYFKISEEYNIPNKWSLIVGLKIFVFVDRMYWHITIIKLTSISSDSSSFILFPVDAISEGFL